MSILPSLIMIIIYFNEFAVTTADDDWFVRREMWQANNYTDSIIIDAYKPVRLVIVSHTASQYCTTTCPLDIRLMQHYFVTSHDSDIPYNFLIGGDGKVYEGRGWNVAGAHTHGYNLCSLGLTFIGDYRESLSSVSTLQEMRAQKLLDEGVKMGYLHPFYAVLAAKDLQNTSSPGENVYKVIQKWPHYDHENRYKDHTCNEIQKLSAVSPVNGCTLLNAPSLLLSFIIWTMITKLFAAIS